MYIRKKVKAALLDKDMTIKDLANRMDQEPGTPPQGYQTLYNSLQKNNMQVDKLQRIASALDCDIVLRDRKSGKIY